MNKANTQTYCFIAVNYGTSDLIDSWVTSIKKTIPKNLNTRFIIVDNYHSKDERDKIRDITIRYSIELIESENNGYGTALNKGISHFKKSEIDKDTIIFAGNLDVEFTNIPSQILNGRNAYIPQIYESKRNRNPFLTHLQKKTIFVFTPASKTHNVSLFLAAVFVNKFIGFFPSRPWAIHGSLFCISSDAIGSEPIFNKASFLYAEELEFASYIEKNNISLIEINISIKHHAHAATIHIGTTKSLKIFMKYWCPAFNNWKNRWK